MLIILVYFFNRVYIRRYAVKKNLNEKYVPIHHGFVQF
jgi:hypothetical protein